MRLQELGATASSIGKLHIMDVERLFLAMKDLLKVSDTKIQTPLQAWIKQMLGAHPALLSMQGNRLFKAIRNGKLADDAKLKVG